MRSILIILVGAFLITGCASLAATPEATRLSPTSTAITPEDGWSDLLQKTPYPFTTPLPSPIRTLVDGTFTKVDPKVSTPVPCRRCPDYAPEGGIWKLNFDKGIYRIRHVITNWKSIGSFTVLDDKITLFNDPNCPDVIGVYNWRIEAGQLILQVIDDSCAIKLRALNLTQQPWQSCQPPNLEAAISGHWLIPIGCE